MGSPLCACRCAQRLWWQNGSRSRNERRARTQSSSRRSPRREKSRWHSAATGPRPRAPAGRGDGGPVAPTFLSGAPPTSPSTVPETSEAPSTRRVQVTKLMNKHNLPPVLRLERLGELLFRSFQRSPQPINSPSIILGLELQRTNLRTGRSRPLSRRRRLQIIINRRCQR